MAALSSSSSSSSSQTRRGRTRSADHLPADTLMLQPHHQYPHHQQHQPYPQHQHNHHHHHQQQQQQQQRQHHGGVGGGTKFNATLLCLERIALWLCLFLTAFGNMMIRQGERSLLSPTDTTTATETSPYMMTNFMQHGGGGGGVGVGLHNNNNNNIPITEACLEIINMKNLSSTASGKLPQQRTAIAKPSMELSFSSDADLEVEQDTSLINRYYNNKADPRYTIRRTQIENYKRGTGLMLNVHITHHGGTLFCSAIGHSPSIPRHMLPPSFACLGIQPKDNVTDTYEKRRPWMTNETQHEISIMRKYFHMISWEFKRQVGPPFLRDTDWEDPNLLSILVIRDPLSRFMSGDEKMNRYFPGLIHGNGTSEQWAGLAEHRLTNNFALSILAAPRCCNGEYTGKRFLDRAKALVERFTVVIDISCFEDGLIELSNMLNITLNKMKKPKQRKPVRERFPNQEIYEHFVRRNKRDIELYMWAKERSIVRCPETIDGVFLSQAMNKITNSQKN